MAPRTIFAPSKGRTSFGKTLLQGVGRIGIVAGLSLAFFLPTRSVAQLQDSDQEAQPAQNQVQNQTSSASFTDKGPLITVRGQVRNAVTGEPLPRALVRIEGDASTGALTDGEGHFEILGVPVGPQIFEVRKPGFYDSPSANRDAEVESRAGSTHNVVLTASMPDLIFTLAPTNSIRGQIVLSSGDPALDIPVELLQRTIADGRAVWQMAGAAKTNSEGIYRFAGLTAGSYAVYTYPVMESEAVTSLVEPGSGGAVARSGYASVFYPDARDLSGAAKIKLSGGEQAQANLVLTLEPFHAVTAVAVLPQSGSPSREAAKNLAATVLDAAGHRLPYAAQYDAATDTIQTSLPEGSYTLLVTSQPQEQDHVLRGRFYSVSSTSSNGTLAGSASLSIAGRAVANLRIPLTPAPAHQVQLTVIHSATGAAGSSDPTLATLPQEGKGSVEVMASQTGEWISDGMTISFAQQMQIGANSAAYLPPGSYWLRAFTASSGLCEQSFTAAGAGLVREPLVVGLTGALPPLELTLRDDCAKLMLSLPQSLTAIPAGEEPFYTAYVVPAFESTVSVEPLTLRPSSGGVVTLEGLTPGTYRVFTFNAPLLLEYRNPAAMAALPNPGQTVTLSPGAVSNLVLEVPERR